MNKLSNPHPLLDDLLLYLDGELPPSRQDEIRRHLEGCWKCRREAEELSGAVSEYMRYQSVVDEATPLSTRQASAKLLRKMESLEAVPQPTSFWSGWRRRFHLPVPGLVWRTAAGVAVLATAWAAIGLVQRILRDPGQANPPRQLPPVIRPVAPTSPLAPIPTKRLPSRPLAEAPIRPAMPAAVPEIAALVKLHELGADLGEPVETVAGADGAVTIICRQVGRERESEIRTALAGIPRVTVHSEPSAPADSGRQPRITLSLRNGGGVLEHALSAKLGGKAPFDRLANDILDDADGLMTRAYALHDLEERFPTTRRAGLRPDDALALASVIADHQQVAFERGRAIEARLAPVSKLLGFPSRAPVAAHDLFAAAQRMDRILNVCFGGSPTDLTLAELGVELSAARAQLRDALEALR